MTLQKAELSLEDNNRLGSSGVEQETENLCVGGANPSRATIIIFFILKLLKNQISFIE